MRTDDDRIGIGGARTGGIGFTHEHSAAMKIMAAKHFDPALVGADPLDINGWTERLDTAWRRGWTSAKAWFEVVLYELIGKKLGAPLPWVGRHLAQGDRAYIAFDQLIWASLRSPMPYAESANTRQLLC